MSRRNDNIESLLLLCCLVGAVSFFSLSLAISKFLTEVSEVGERDLIAERNRLGQMKQREEAILDSLLRHKDILEKEIIDASWAGRQDRYYDMQLRKLQWICDQLKTEYDSLENSIKKLEAQISALGIQSNIKVKEQKEKELEEYIKRKKELEHWIEEKERLLAAQLKTIPSASVDKSPNSQEQCDELSRKKTALEKEINSLNIKVITAGTEHFKNPLYVDCKKDIVTLYPSRKSIFIKELEHEGLFNQLMIGHDIVVLYVRPDGFESFRMAFFQAKTGTTPLSYEPIGAEQNLDFLVE